MNDGADFRLCRSTAGRRRYFGTPSLLAHGETRREFLRQVRRADFLLRDFKIVRNARNRQRVFFKFVIDDAGPRIRITRLTDGTHVHQDSCVRFDGLLADVVDIWQLRAAIQADQRRMAVAAEGERILLVVEIQLDGLLVAAVVVVVRRVGAMDQIEIFIGRKRFRASQSTSSNDSCVCVHSMDVLMSSRRRFVMSASNSMEQ